MQSAKPYQPKNKFDRFNEKIHNKLFIILLSIGVPVAVFIANLLTPSAALQWLVILIKYFCIIMLFILLLLYLLFITPEMYYPIIQSKQTDFNNLMLSINHDEDNAQQLFMYSEQEL